MVVSPTCSRLEGRGSISLRNPAATRPWQHVLEAALHHWPCSWRDGSDPHAPDEAGRLHLQIDKAHHQLGWQPRWRAVWRIWRPGRGRPWVVILSQDGHRVVTTDPTAERTVSNRRGGAR